MADVEFHRTERVHDRHQVPQALIGALFRQPQALQATLDEAGLAPHDLALWARQSGAGAEIEKRAGWLSVGQRPGHYKPLLEVAASHLRAGDLLEALPVFRWAYSAWQQALRGQTSGSGGGARYDGAKLLALWGECLYLLNQPAEALQRWRWALSLVPDEQTLVRLARTMERAGAAPERKAVLAEALRRDLPGAAALWQRRQRQPAPDEQLPVEQAWAAEELPGRHADPPVSQPRSGVAVIADVANLDMVCADQYGYGRRLDYGRLLARSAQHGPLQVQIAFVPDVPETLAIRRHLAIAGFEIDLKRPKRSHGRLSADADAAIAAAAVRWASDPQVGRLELWSGDGDFLKVREVVGEAWPEVTVAYRSFEVGTAAGIRRLGSDWMSIGAAYLQP
jgi:tetratricopeptide (TPR) repeat protein